MSNVTEINVTAYKHARAEFRKEAGINNTRVDEPREIRSSSDDKKMACSLSGDKAPSPVFFGKPVS